MLDVILLLLVLLLLDDLILLNCLAECVIVTSVVGQLLLGQPNDVGAYTIQEVLRMEGKMLRQWQSAVGHT